MIVLSGALVLVALVLLVFGALDRNLPYVYASIGVSVLSLLLLVVGVLQRRGELSGEDEHGTATPVTDTSTDRVPALVGADQERSAAGPADRGARTAALSAPPAAPVEEPAAPASRRVRHDQEHLGEEPVVGTPDDEDRAVEDRDAEDHGIEDHGVEDHGVEDRGVEDRGVEDRGAEDHGPEDEGVEDLGDEEPEDEGAGVPVLVVSGRPRYHLEGCRVVRGKQAQPLDRDEARHHGFTPCGVCKPDADESAGPEQPVAAGSQPADDGLSFTEALFGEPLFADRPPTEPDAQPDRPVQPVLPEVEPAAATGARRRGRPASGPAAPADDVAPVELQGEDPADDPTLVADPDATAEPSRDVAANPDEPAEADSAAPDETGPGTAVERPVRDVAPTGEAVEPAGPDGPAVAGAEVDEPTPDGPAVDGPDVDEPAPDQPVVDEPVVDEPVVEPVAAEDVPVGAPPAVDAEPSTEASGTDGPVRRRRTSRKPVQAPAETAPAAGASAAAEQVPPKRTAKKTAAKQAPAKRVPAKRVPAERAPAKAAAAPAPEPPVKRPLVRTVRADALRLGATSTGGTTTRVSVRAAAPATGASVVVVPDRDRFHRPECRFARGVAGATTLPKASATRQGYAACGVCKP